MVAKSLATVPVGPEYEVWLKVPEAALAPMPANITFEQAASVPTSGLIALHNSRTREGYSQASVSWSTALVAAWVRSSCRSRKPTGRGHRNKAACERDVYSLLENLYPHAKVRDATRPSGEGT